MSVMLDKGANVSLTKAAPGLSAVIVGLGWDPREDTGQDYDLDASALLLGADGRVLTDEHFVFYGNLRSPDGCVVHTGDNLDGSGEGDDEVINVALADVSTEVHRIVFPVSIHDAEERGQNFGQVTNAFIRVLDAETERELTRFDLREDASTETAMIFGELYRHAGDWKFRAIGQGYESGLRGIVVEYGVDVD